MGLFRRLAGMLGFAKDENHEDDDDTNSHTHSHSHSHSHSHPVNEQNRNRVKLQETGLPRKGFGVPVQVAVDRPHLAPIVVPCNSGDGGLQGLRWYAKRLRIDEDGDVADEFLEEVLLETSSSNEEHDKPKPPLPKFQVKYSTRPARVKKQAISKEGKLQQCVEHRGRLEWV